MSDCQGDQDDLTGEYVCANENVWTYRTRAPWSDKWITVRWCDAHASEAKSLQYRLEPIANPAAEADCGREHGHDFEIPGSEGVCIHCGRRRAIA